MTIIEFLEARIAEDEAAARGAAEGLAGSGLDWVVAGQRQVRYVNGAGDMYVAVTVAHPAGPYERIRVMRDDSTTAAHIARHDPARVLAECAAKRAIMGGHEGRRDLYGGRDAYLCEMCTETGPNAQGWPCETLRALAAVYSDHPDYDKDWAL